jgi:hypothetical protein
MNTILTNLHKAREVIAAIPEVQFDLKEFTSEGSCGTIACTAGWLCHDPYFQGFMKLGVAYDGATYETLRVKDLSSADWLVRYDLLDDHFGADAFDALFTARCDGKFDWLHPLCEVVEDSYEPESVSATGELLTDKELALWRIDQQVNRIKAQETGTA